MGGGRKSNDNSSQLQMQMYQQQQQDRTNQQYAANLQAQQSYFDSIFAQNQAMNNVNLSAKTQTPNGGYYGAQTLPLGTYLSSSSSRNTFLGG